VWCGGIDKRRMKEEKGVKKKNNLSGVGIK